MKFSTGYFLCCDAIFDALQRVDQQSVGIVLETTLLICQNEGLNFWDLDISLECKGRE